MAEKGVLAVLCLQIFYIYTRTLAFNLDTRVPIVKEGKNPGSYFGFSIAQHQLYDHSTADTFSQVVLVGAPRDNISEPTASQEDINLRSPGVVYQCPFSSDLDDCKQIKITIENPSSSVSSKKIDKNNQWFGVTVSSQGTRSRDSKAIACAHRHKVTGPSYVWGLGICVALTNALDQDKIVEPCSEKPVASAHEQYGFCQSGASAAIYEDQDYLIGAPGPFKWRGVVFKNTLSEGLESDNYWYESVPKAVPTYSYLGESVAVGKVLGGKKTYIAGAPRAKDVGQVLFFQPNQTDHMLQAEAEDYLTGEQFGSHFGLAVLPIDLNDDGAEDLVVGAPFYTGDNVGGAIYVFMNGGTSKRLSKNTKSKKKKVPTATLR